MQQPPRTPVISTHTESSKQHILSLGVLNPLSVLCSSGPTSSGFPPLFGRVTQQELGSSVWAPGGAENLMASSLKDKNQQEFLERNTVCWGMPPLLLTLTFPEPTFPGEMMPRETHKCVATSYHRQGKKTSPWNRLSHSPSLCLIRPRVRAGGGGSRKRIH